MKNYRTKEAATILDVQPCTMEAWRVRGGGPVFLKMGKAVRYRDEDLQDFMRSKLRKNTSENVQQCLPHGCDPTLRRYAVGRVNSDCSGGGRQRRHDAPTHKERFKRNDINAGKRGNSQ